jgi:hypothetical protein
MNHRQCITVLVVLQFLIHVAGGIPGGLGQMIHIQIFVANTWFTFYQQLQAYLNGGGTLLEATVPFSPKLR